MSTDDPLNGLVQLSFSDDGLECTARIAAGADRSDLGEGAVSALLGRKGVVTGMIDEDAVSAFVADAVKTPGEDHAAVLARGIEPEHGIAGHFAFAEEIQSQFDAIERREHVLRHAPPLESTGRSPAAGIDAEGIDFYNVSAFVIVRRGATIGTVLEPTPGRQGTTVRGEVIPAEAGAGTGVSFGEGLEVKGGSEVRAAIDGRLERGIEEIRVEDTLRVRGSVDFSTGNVCFPGDVIVNGGVRDRFLVRADGNIEIRDLVEAGEIETDHDVTFATGMAGREIGSVRIGGSLTARYLDGVSGRIDGACSVAREINACDLTIGTTLNCPTGAIMGGIVRVAQACDVGQVGGQGGVETHLHLGWFKELEDAIAALDAAVDERVPKTNGKRKPDRNSVYALLRTGQRVAAAIDKLTECSLKVQKAIHPGVHLVGRGWAAEFSAPVEGPLVIETDHAGEPTLKGLARGERIPLARVAKVRTDDTIAPVRETVDRLHAAA